LTGRRVLPVASGLLTSTVAGVRCTDRDWAVLEGTGREGATAISRRPVTTTALVAAATALAIALAPVAAAAVFVTAFIITALVIVVSMVVLTVVPVLAVVVALLVAVAITVVTLRLSRRRTTDYDGADHE
jgi:hypothetical protein